MKISSKIYFCFLLVQSFPNFTKFYSSEHAAATSTVIMNGKKFTHTKKSDNGVQTEQFLINDVPVEQDEFHHELNSLKLAQMNQDEQESQRKVNEQENMKLNLKTAVLEKLIKQSMTDLQDALVTLEEPLLKPYLVFHTQGITSQSDFDLIKSWTTTLQKNIKSMLSNHDYEMLQKLALEIETKVEQVHHCLKQSIQKATSECDDTATLKKLLMLIEA